MKKYICLIFILITGPVLAMGDRHKNHYQQNYALVQRISGPVIKGYSEFSTMFTVVILDVTHIVLSDDGFLDFDLFPLKISNGVYPVKITPMNFFGDAPTVLFNLQVTGGKTKIWKIVLIPKLIKNDPDYTYFFSEDLLVEIPP